MAEIQNPTPTRYRRASTKVDFTAMVDLAFLLITFFMLTTVLARPNVMPVVMPEYDGEDEMIKASHSLTLILDKEDKVRYYEGIFMGKMDSTDFSDQGVRKVILEKMDRVAQQWGLQEQADTKHPGETKMHSKLYVVIKAAPSSRYCNLVDTFDELKICGVARYVVVPLIPEEVTCLHQ